MLNIQYLNCQGEKWMTLIICTFYVICATLINCTFYVLCATICQCCLFFRADCFSSGYFQYCLQALLLEEDRFTNMASIIGKRWWMLWLCWLLADFSTIVDSCLNYYVNYVFPFLHALKCLIESFNNLDLRVIIGIHTGHLKSF